jgi:hypothetical protein
MLLYSISVSNLNYFKKPVSVFSFAFDTGLGLLLMGQGSFSLLKYWPQAFPQGIQYLCH